MEIATLATMVAFGVNLTVVIVMALLNHWQMDEMEELMKANDRLIAANDRLLQAHAALITTLRQLDPRQRALPNGTRRPSRDRWSDEQG